MAVPNVTAPSSADADSRAPRRPGGRISSALLLVLAGLGACSMSSDDATNAADGSRAPRRIVSLSCAATDVVSLLGEMDRLVAVEEDCPCGGTEGKVTIRNEDHAGKLAAFNVESVMALHPDAVIAKPDLREVLSNRGLRVAFTPESPTWESIPALVTTVGALLKMPERAKALLDRMREKEADVRHRTAGLRRVRVYYETTGLGWTVGSTAVMSVMIELAGGENIAKGVEKAGAMITAEAILAADPDVIVLGAFADPIATVSTRPGWDRLAAVRAGRVFHLTPERRGVTLATPRCVDECEAVLLPWLHPEAAAAGGSR
jgi:iron complex transport system substrate-binding protein